MAVNAPLLVHAYAKVNLDLKILGVEIDDEGAETIASRSRGTPRVANRLLKRVRDYAQVHGDGSIDAATAYLALDMLEVDHEGLDRLAGRKPA